MTESFLQYVWQHQMIGKGLSTTDGQPVVVLRPGELNHDAGPDFFNARLTIDGVEWVGNVEVHLHSSDWNTHHHSRDQRYNNIILHVVYEHDCEVVLENGLHPMTLELRRFMHPSLVKNYESLVLPKGGDDIPCFRRFSQVPSFVISSFLDRLVVERIESKTEVVHRLLEESNDNWEQTCYWLIAHYWGGKVNAIPFEMLAKSVDYRLLARWKGDVLRLEAILIGQAGFLEGPLVDDYPLQLQTDYHALKFGIGLVPIDNYIWRFHCLRPNSFPTIRISQFASLMAQSSNLFGTLLSKTNVKELEKVFDCRATEYWDNHYRIDQESSNSSVKRVGKALADSLIINAWVPLLFAYGTLHGQQQYKDQAIGLLQQLAPEKNNIIRRWQEAGASPENAAQTQALIQLSNNYCGIRRCLECRIGYHIIKSIK